MNGTLAISDGELFLKAREGDQAAFAELIDRHKAGLVNYLTYLCGDLDRAEDLAQEAFIRLYERGTGYSDQGKLQAYQMPKPWDGPQVQCLERVSVIWGLARLARCPPSNFATRSFQPIVAGT